jgi:hypothetical protein
MFSSSQLTAPDFVGNIIIQTDDNINVVIEPADKTTSLKTMLSFAR